MGLITYGLSHANILTMGLGNAFSIHAPQIYRSAKVSFIDLPMRVAVEEKTGPVSFVEGETEMADKV